jgi:hypothetical protein
MSLEAIAAMLGHRSPDMTLRYAKIASRTVADEYFAVTGKVEALYGQPPVLPGDAIGPQMARLRREHHRMLGNGYCTRPGQLPAPRTGDDSPAALSEATDSLARLRTPYWLSDPGVRLHALASLIAQAGQLLP